MKIKTIRKDGVTQTYNIKPKITTDEKAIKLAGGFSKGVKFLERAPQFGERAWVIKGKIKHIFIQDMGNGNCKIIAQIAVSTLKSAMKKRTKKTIK